MNGGDYRVSPDIRPLFELVEGRLLQAEAALSLVESLTPRNFESEHARLRAGCERGNPELPRFIYLSSHQLRGRAMVSRRYLGEALRAMDSFSGTHPLLQLLEERAEELSLEAKLIDCIGTDEFSRIAKRRFSFEQADVEEARHLADVWTLPTETSEEGDAPLESLASLLNDRARKEEHRLGISILVCERDLASVAAVGGDCLFVKRGALATRAEARRIWVHEVQGHLLPRLRAKRRGVPFRIGTKGCWEDEEGRATLLEERTSSLNGARRLELGVRFSLGWSALQTGPAGALAAAKEILTRGIRGEVVARNLARVLRGGGLGREMIYLPAYVRVKRALTQKPELESWMEAGRISVWGARCLVQCESP